MRKIKKKSFDWYGTRQHFSIRKYHFGAASVLLGMSLAVGTGTTVQAEDTVVASETLASSTTVVSSTESTPSSETSTTASTETSATVAESVDNASDTLAESTETVTSSLERKATINYIIQYIDEAGSLVDAALQTITIPTTDAVGTATVGISLELPAGYELAPGQSASLSQEVTEGAENIVTIKVVKKEAVATSTNTTTEVSTTSDNVADTPATSTSIVEETVKTPATVEEAKVVLEQVTSEAEVLANEAERLVAASDSDNTALKAAAAATKLTATEATAVLNDSTATLEAVNAQIDAVRTNVEALALELRKYYLNGDIVALMNTTTSATTTTSLDVNNPNSAAYAQHGIWEIPDPVKAANSGLLVADQPATITEADKNYPAGYSGDQDPNRDTFLIYSLDTVNGYGDGNNFNDWVGKNYYITFSVSTDKAEREANDVVYAKLVEKTANGDNVVNTIQLTPGVKNNFDELKVLEGNKDHNTTYSFLYTVQTTGGTTRNLAISNTNGSNKNTHLYNKLETAKEGTEFNSSTALVPGTAKQTTTYYVKENADTDRPREMLAKYSQTDGLVGDKFHIAGPIDFNNYELISSELPTVTSGILASDYTKGAQWIVLRGNYNEARLLTITDEDGSLQYQMYMLDPQNPNWANFYKNNMEKATIADLKDYFKLMFTSEVIAPGNKNTKEGLFEEKFYEANKLVLENTIVQVLDKNGDVLGTLSDDKTTINVPNGKNISVAKATDTMVTDVNGDLYTVNHLKVYKKDADGNYVDADGNILTPLKWHVDAPQRKVNGKDEIYPGYGTETPFTTDTIRVETGPWDKANMNEATESVWYYGWNYHTASDETRLTDSEAGKTAWDVGGLEMSMPNNNLKNEQHVRYWYAEKGGVEVYYVTSDGTVLTDFTAKDGSTVADKNVIVDHGDTNSAYDTTSVRYESITAADGTVYYYKEIDTTTANLHSVVNDTIDADYRANEKIDAETGVVKTDTVKQITYVYEKAGNVVVNYVTEEGTPLSGVTNTGLTTESTVDDTKNGQPGTTYDTTNLKPTTITTADGKTYQLVPAGTYNVGTVGEGNNLTTVGNGTATGIDGTTGTVESGVTKEVTYVYKEVKGDVIVHYVDQDGNPISGTTDAGTTTASTVTDTPESSTGTPYDTTDLKPNTITTADGKVYRLVPAATQGNEKGDVVVGTTEITYVYELVEGDVIVHYVDTEGNTIASDVTDTPTSDTGTDYDTTDNKPEKIVNDETGDVYYYKEVKAGDNETGKVVEGTTEVTYIYEKAGSVNVNYVDTDGKPLLDPVADVTDGKPGSDYDTLVDNKHETIATADGKLYRLVPAGTYKVGTVSDDNNLTAVGNGTATGVDSVTGTVEAGTTKEITYVYEEVKGDVKVEYYDTDGNVIATTVVDTPTSSTGTPYNTLDKKPATITAADGTVYYYKEVKSTSAAEDGTVVEGTTTVQYVYEKAGSVNVNYVDTEGKVISPKVADETNEKAGTEYSTTDNKPSTITTEDGKTYRLVEAGTYNVGTVSDDNNLTSVGNGTATGVDSTTGTVEAGTTKEITYVYEEVKGNVVVNYITTDGTVIKQPVEDTPSTSTGTPYNTTDSKPTTITTEDGKTYRIVPTLTKGNETGDVVEGTTSITYVYEEVKGDVVVEYYDTEGNLISGLSDSGEAVDIKEVDTPSTSTGTAYNTDEDHKPNTITTADGTLYYYKEVKDTSASTTGEVVEGTTTVQYVYEKAGNVIVHYITEDGTVIKATVTDEENAESGKSYTTTDNKPTTITTADGTVYELIPTATIGNEDGSVEAGKTIEVTYVYRKVETPTPADKEGNVVVNYITTDGTVIKQPVEDTPSTSTGTPYDTTDNKPTTITTEDGKTYRIVPTLTKGNETGDVVEGTTSITYVYEEVKGDVVVNYVNTAGEVIASQVVDTKTTSTGTDYDTTDNKPAKITTEDGTVYYYKEVDATSATETGKVVEGTTEITYVYEQAGSVTVNYVTTDGTVIKSPVKDEENAEPGKTYSTEDNKPTTITTEDGKTYKLVPNATTGEENGTITSGEDKQVTYVYEEVKGDVVVNYIDTEGNVIKAPVTDTPSTSTGTAYDTTDNKPETIITEDGTEYKLVPVLTKGEENGSVVEGTTQVTYVYQKVTPAAKTGNVVVEYYNTVGEKIASDVVDTPETTTGTIYETLDFKPATITKDGVTYYYKEVKDTSAAEKGTVVEGTTTVQYVYEPAGSVTVNYVTTDGTVIKSPVKDEENAEPGKTYSTEDNKPETITTEDGKTYKLVPNATTGEENGTITSGEDKQVTYVYEEVKGDVVVNYIDTEGNVIKAPVTDTSSTSTGTAYDTTDNKPETITTEDGTEYKLVPVLTKGEENGSVVEGTTQVTYVYQKVTTPAPNPNGSVVVNYVNTNGETIATSVNDTTDAALDTAYDTTDYKPAVIKHNGVTYFYKEVKTGDNETGKVIEGTTEVTYIYEPAGSVTVNYVTTDGTVIKTPVKDEENAEPGKTYTTEDNKPTTITTEDGKTYHIVPKLTTGEENGTITSGEDKQVTYVYEEVTGDVVVNYIDTEGNVIKAPVTDTPVSSTGTSYDTTDNKPTSITTEDGSVYELIPVLTKGEESGKVVAGTTQVTYIYRKVSSPTPVVQTGNVVVEYYNTAGEKIAEDVVDTPETTTGTSYDTTEFKPSTITKDGVKYFYKEVKGTSAGETGTVVEGTTTVQYVYEPAGSVTVNYVSTDGTVIKTPVKDEENAEPGKTYSTEDQKPTVITTEDGKTYHIVPKLTTGEENGTITSGEDKQVTYVYEEVTGDVVVNYIDTEGNVIKAPVTDTNLTSTGTTYDTTDNKPTTITTDDGSVYELVPVLTKGEESGKVVAGTTQVTYVYRKVSSPTPVVQTGNVVVEYYNTAGEKIAEDVVDTPETTIGTVYETLDYKPTTITKDGIIYFYKEVKDTSAAEKGRVVEGTTIVQYVYEPAGSVTVNYVTTDGSVIKPSVKDEANAEPGKTYSTEEQKTAVITTEDGKTYQIVPKLTTGEENGTITSGEDKQVTYVYEEVTGDVVVNYIDTEGNVIKAPVTDTPTTSTGTAYDTTDNKLPTITTEDGSVYELVPVLTQGAESGRVTAGSTQVTYVYRKVVTPTPDVKTGSVVIRYVEAGNESNVLKDPVLDENAVATGTKYDTTDEGDKPTEIVKDGVRYVLVPSKTTAVDPSGNVVTETGEVAEGTTVITYKYQKVANWIPQIPATPENPTPVNPVIPYPFDPTNPDKPIDPTTPGTNGEVPSIPHVPGYTPVDPKTNEPLKPVDPTDPSKGYVPPTPDESGIDTPIPYVQNGNVVVNYVDENGNVIKTPVQDETNAPAGKSYDTTDNKPTEIVTEDGSRYVLIPSKTVGSETGSVEGGKTTEITYVYKKVANWIPQIPATPE
ncbi:TPA: MucBP domain-containing protein, partial [Streptococcus suis]|nr:MucBP domain-containing protein [Streptococcus suis]